MAALELVAILMPQEPMMPSCQCFARRVNGFSELDAEGFLRGPNP